MLCFSNSISRLDFCLKILVNLSYCRYTVHIVNYLSIFLSENHPKLRKTHGKITHYCLDMNVDVNKV